MGLVPGCQDAEAGFVVSGLSGVLLQSVFLLYYVLFVACDALHNRYHGVDIVIWAFNVHDCSLVVGILPLINVSVGAQIHIVVVVVEEGEQR